MSVRFNVLCFPTVSLLSNGTLEFWERERCSVLLWFLVCLSVSHISHLYTHVYIKTCKLSDLQILASSNSNCVLGLIRSNCFPLYLLWILILRPLLTNYSVDRNQYVTHVIRWSRPINGCHVVKISYITCDANLLGFVIRLW